MFLGIIRDSKLIPNYYYHSVFDINYTKLYASGIRFILTDLDNTLISYKENEPNDKLYEWVKKRKEEGFEIVIVSNNSHKDRVSKFAEMLGLEYINFACKPSKRGFKKANKLVGKKYKKDEIIAIGDQIFTDVLAANRMGYQSVLVKAIDNKTEIWTTRLNRKLERNLINRLKKKNPKLYERTLKRYEEDKNGRD